MAADYGPAILLLAVLGSVRPPLVASPILAEATV